MLFRFFPPITTTQIQRSSLLKKYNMIFTRYHGNIFTNEQLISLLLFIHNQKLNSRTLGIFDVPRLDISVEIITIFFIQNILNMW